MPDSSDLIKLLAVPGVHSGTDLGERLGISRVAIKKRIDRLQAAGFPVDSVAGRGYQLKPGVELLSAQAISEKLVLANTAMQPDIQWFHSLDSTNRYLEQQDLVANRLQVVVAESQPEGQGRRGRAWVASAYKNLMLSIGYRYPAWPQNTSAISLAFAVAVHRALVGLGAASVQLKWPNDIVANNSKLGGLLVTASGEAGGELSLVLGVGINVDLAADLLQQIDQPAIDLRRLDAAHITRNQLAAEIISNTAEMLSLYPESGFQPFADYWNSHAIWIGQQVRLFDGAQEYCGELQGVDANGELCLLDKQGHIGKFNSAELSLRPL